MQHVVMFSGGIASWATARRVAQEHGTDNLTLLFADTRIEDEDTYRFLEEAAEQVGGELVWLCEGRTPWEVFFDERYLGNIWYDPCSLLLKREPLQEYTQEHFDPQDTILYFGFTADEQHRADRARELQQPWQAEAPLCDCPRLDREALLEECRAVGLEPPRMYGMGFSHANCGGFCVKGGIWNYRRLLKYFPERYAHHERQEQALREYLGREDISIIRDRRGGENRPVTLREFREREQDLYWMDVI